MNGSKSPGPTTRSGDSSGPNVDAPAAADRDAGALKSEEQSASTLPAPVTESELDGLPDAPASGAAEDSAVNGADDDPASEAETLIDSPVKRKEAAKKQNASTAASNAKREKAQKSRIGSLPVPNEDDDDLGSAASPMPSTEISTGKATPSAGAHDEDEDAEGSDDDLSSARSSPDASRASSRSRALSENPSRKDTSPPNPRKRKHRASSVDNLLNTKRRSMDPPARRRLRGMHSEDPSGKADRSPSPKPRGHRRAISTQSGLGGHADGEGRKRRGSQFPVREPRSAKTWEESDASSETTSRGQDDYSRPQRGVGRSTSIPGARTAGREHKRHVNKYGFTRLAEACEAGDLDLVKELFDKDPDAVELAEFAGNKPLQIAALNGNAEVVAYLIEQGAQTDCANVDKDTPLIDAAENGHLEVVKLLLEAGVDPLRQNLKGQQALDVITDETEDATNIRAALHSAIEDWTSNSAKQRREEEEEEVRHSHPPRVTSKELHFMARSYENLLKLVQNNDRTGVQEFLAARVPVDNTVIAAAAKTGDVYLVNMLLAEMDEKKLRQKAEKPMLAVLGSSHFEMVKTLTEMEWFDPLWRDRRGKTWMELAEEKNGPAWRREKELMRELSEKASRNKERRSSSPVTKRDSGGRRKVQQQPKIEEHDESEDDEMDDNAGGNARTRNKRRLMSRKDLRTAKSSSAALDEDSGEVSSEEDAPGEVDEEEMPEVKPQETPSTDTRRRLRTKSQSGSPEVTPRTLRRKRASSNAMPTVNEEDQENAEPSNTETIHVAHTAENDNSKEAKAALDLAKHADEKRKEEEAAELEATQAQEAAERQAEEEKQKAETAKMEELARQDAERQAEEARKAEEERLQRELEREREKEEEKRKYRGEVLDALPKAVAKSLDPESASLLLNDAEKKRLVQYFTPLRVLAEHDGSPQQQFWLLNIQVAPLLGRSGLQLFFDSDYPDYEQCLPSQWDTSELAPSDWLEIDNFLAQLPFDTSRPSDPNGEGMSFDEEIKQASERHNAYLEARKTLRDPSCKARLRRVRVKDVSDNLQPLCKDMKFEVEFVGPSTKQRQQAMKQLEIQDTQDFVGRMKAFWESALPPRVVSSLAEIEALADGRSANYEGARSTDVVVVHEK
ncbi:hypothetical protein BDY17DRAFT_295304 [Neohortaea acidophila]|uniref:Uncharacterized protein n=1 Tax=Neohortaea acidophila TaxID=245834 RepID=A0A6A6PXM9_9PEZI|nr:uncharacterized protein BDY17DRAFT_295304 [Neohortaea acidophila]KAF2484253.1 hypothetical protein BDY17DRAFT_295304 [Neohortaea acidophila]